MKDDLFHLCDQLRESSLALHRHLRHGHLERVYEAGLANRLRKLNLPCSLQHPLQVRDEDGTILGDFVADMLVDGRLIVELKACRSLADEHVAQLLGYLRATQIEHGLLINFGSPRLEIRKFALSRV